MVLPWIRRFFNMSVGHCDVTGLGQPLGPAIPVPVEQPMQRLATVRKQQGISRYAMARRLNIHVDQLREQERETADIPLSVLYAWQKALDVPAVELLVEANDALSTPVLQRSQLVRLMKTVLAVCEHSKQESIRRMAQTMSEQLTEMMPELANIGPWHAVGKRRRLDELGVAAQRQLSDSLFIEEDDY
jgi:transcriptional regulator with XRE-family HTH domain